MIDFSKCIRTFNKFAGSEKKAAIIYNENVYMIKFPDPPRALKADFSYKNNQFSEYVGSHIFDICGFNTQKTELSFINDEKGKRKVVVACKDFTQDGSILYEFSKFGDAFVDSENDLTTTIEHVYKIIECNTLLLEKQYYIDSFWNMFVIDCLIGNGDRHLNNFGVLVKGSDVKFAPIYDCGSSLGALFTDERMEQLLTNESEFKSKEYNSTSCYSYEGKRVFYHMLFADPPQDLKNAILQITPKINMNAITSFIESIDCVSAVRKKYMIQSITIRYEKIILPAYKKQLEKEKENEKATLSQAELRALYKTQQPTIPRVR